VFSSDNGSPCDLKGWPWSATGVDDDVRAHGYVGRRLGCRPSDEGSGEFLTDNARGAGVEVRTELGRDDSLCTLAPPVAPGHPNSSVVGLGGVTSRLGWGEDASEHEVGQYLAEQER
jgi:hypothetical protein